jgi:hypothetical protein
VSVVHVALTATCAGSVERVRGVWSDVLPVCLLSKSRKPHGVVFITPHPPPHLLPCACSMCALRQVLRRQHLPPVGTQCPMPLPASVLVLVLVPGLALPLPQASPWPVTACWMTW